MGFAKFREDLVSRWVSDNSKQARAPQAVGPQVPKGAPGSGGAQAPKQEKEMSELKEFTMSSARPLPVIVLADVSGSMASDGKIEALNEAVAEMIATFAEEDDARAEIHVAVITFGGEEAVLHKPLRPARETKWEPMRAAGRTPMGRAFAKAQALIEDKTAISGRAYRPTLILVSDGEPNDEWKGPLRSLHESERASKAVRFAMAIGADADRQNLEKFLGDSEQRVYEAHEAREIRKFFRWVTMSVTSRSRSASPNTVVVVAPTDLDELEF